LVSAATDLPFPSSRSQPNILFILLDDLRADDLAAMPIAQSHLVAEGTTCANFFATAPLCAPSRASIRRGQYPHNHGVLRGSGVFGGFDLFQSLGEEQSTIAAWLHDTGYRTALIGKYLNGYPDGDGLPAGVTMSFIPPGWDEGMGLINEGYCHFSVNDNGEVNAFQSRKRKNSRGWRCRSRFLLDRPLCRQGGSVRH
jgi:arylsulfatase A-like enzyme